MEISPIAGIRVTPVPKSRPADPELTAFFDIESTARPGDDTYTASGKKAAGAEESDEAEAEDSEEIADDGEHSSSSPSDKPASRINFFA